MSVPEYQIVRELEDERDIVICARNDFDAVIEDACTHLVFDPEEAKVLSEASCTITAEGIIQQVKMIFPKARIRRAQCLTSTKK